MMATIATKITARGNSAGVTLTQPVLEAAGLKLNDDVRIEGRDGEIVIRRSSELHRAFDEAHEWMVGRYGETLARLAK